MKEDGSLDWGELIAAASCAAVITLVISVHVTSCVNDSQWQQTACAKGVGRYVVKENGALVFEWITPEPKPEPAK